MSRSYKKPYTKSKRFDKTCRSNGGCSYCYNNRMHKHNKQITLKEELDMSEPRTCPCGAQTSPDPSCDMCDGWTHDPDTGWGGFYDGYKGKHYSSEEEQQADYESDLFGDIDSDEDDDFLF